tara:strand:- start:148 stop:603 length:456 start_codon:yes stop_codon:yes gene_type:complete
MKIEKKHYWIIGVAAGVITTTGIILYVRHKKKKAAALIESEKKETSQFVDEQGFIEEGENENHLKRDEATGDLFPLQYGSKNESVAALQKYINSTCPSELKKAGVFPLLIDGTWNDDTETAALACSALRRNKIDRETFERISRDLLAANIV